MMGNQLAYEQPDAKEPYAFNEVAVSFHDNGGDEGQDAMKIDGGNLPSPLIANRIYEAV